MPQGSILGPLLSPIYMNDIVDATSTNIHLYAGDSSIYVTGNNDIEMAMKLNEDLQSISKWSKTWHVKFNPTKTVNVLFTRRNQYNRVPLQMDGIQIKDTDKHTHLGCTLQSNGKWNSHIKSLLEKNYKKIDVLRSLRFTIDRKTLELLFHCYIRPSIEYCSTVWTNISKQQRKDIEDLQLAAARIVTGAIKGTKHAEIYEECRWLTTSERRERRNKITFYKIMHNQAPAYLKDIIPPQRMENTGYNLRNRDNLQLIHARTTSHQTSFFPSQVRVWNSLPPEIRHIGSVRDFKVHLALSDKKCKKYYYAGSRYGQIIHARMRMGCSPLRHDLKQMKVVEEEKCDCGHDVEDVEHFFQHCTLYTNIRNTLMQNNIHDGLSLNTHTLLYGDDNIPTKYNSLLFQRVIDYIIKSNRF